MVDTTVKYFSSTMSGAPALSGTAGTLIGVLDACLVNGFGSITLDSLVVASNVATGTLSTGHNFAMVGNTGPVITIAGATPAGLNGEWRLASVPGSTTFTFATTGISNQTATGTITAKRSPAGWAQTYSGTNKAAYSRTSIVATAMLLRVDDTAAQYPTLTMYEAMTNVDTGTGSSGALYFGKSDAANGNARAWRLRADHCAVYFSVQNDATTWYGQFFFGDVVPYLSTDAYHCKLVAHSSAAYGTGRLHYANQTGTGIGVMAREYTQIGGAVNVQRRSHRAAVSYLSEAGATYPNPAGNDFLCCPVEVWNSDATVIRGLMPGLYDPIHSGGYFSQDAYFENIVGLAGRTLQMQKLSSASYCCAIDLTGPWR